MHVVFGQCGNSINVSDKMPGTKVGLDVFFFSTVQFIKKGNMFYIGTGVCFRLFLHVCRRKIEYWKPFSSPISPDWALRSTVAIAMMPHSSRRQEG